MKFRRLGFAFYPTQCVGFQKQDERINRSLDAVGPDGCESLGSLDAMVLAFWVSLDVLDTLDATFWALWTRFSTRSLKDWKTQDRSNFSVFLPNVAWNNSGVRSFGVFVLSCPAVPGDPGVPGGSLRPGGVGIACRESGESPHGESVQARAVRPRGFLSVLRSSHEVYPLKQDPPSSIFLLPEPVEAS